MKRHIKYLSFVLVLTVMLSAVSVALFFDKNEEVSAESPRQTPLMGWASWNAYRTNISEEVILSQARKLKELGLADLGYTYVNVDDGWQNGRSDDGYVNVNEERFPSGMDSLASEIHKLGLKAGIYTDAGVSTCGWACDGEGNNDDVGLLGHEETDLRRYFIDWDYDFIKVDWCGGRADGLDREQRYTSIGSVIKSIEQETGKDKIYNVCCWEFPGEWVAQTADSWRTGSDIANNFDSVLEQIDNIKNLKQYTSPGHVNDLDMMQIGNGMTYEEDKSHFAMWCMMSTPLMLGMDLNSISDETLSIISNDELIAVNQDPACIQASVAKKYGNAEVWTKDLGKENSGTKAIALLNRGNEEVTVTVSFKELGLGDVTSVRDLWAHIDISPDDSFTVTLSAHETAVLKVSGTVAKGYADDGSEVDAEMSLSDTDSSVNLTETGTFDWVYLGANTVCMKNGADEIDVQRSGGFYTYRNNAVSYKWTNGDITASSDGENTVSGAKDLSAEISVILPCDRNIRTLIVSSGCYAADMKAELIVGGKVIDSVLVEGKSSTRINKTVTARFSSDIATAAVLKLSVDKALNDNASVSAESAALSIDVTSDSIGEISSKISDGKLSCSVPFTSTQNDAVLSFVLYDIDGNKVAEKTQKVNGNNAGRFSADFELDGLFAGRVTAAMTKDGNTLCDSVEKTVNAASENGYNIGPMTAKSLIAKGAVLIDVRSPEEYETGHIDGAINLEYTKVLTEAEKLFPDKSTAVILYCSAAKRSAQAANEFLKLGYIAVYNLGSMSNFYSEASLTFSRDTCQVVTAGERVDVSYTASPFDSPEVYVSAGEKSGFSDAVPLDSFTVPEYDGYYLTLKAYLAYDNVCYAETEHRFIYWSESTVDAFAAELNWKKETSAYGEVAKNSAWSGGGISVAGKAFSHGIGAHATSDIVMDIPKNADKFLSVAGCDDTSSGATVIFYVYIDGALADSSPLLTKGQQYVFDIDIPDGAEEIRLYAYRGTYSSSQNEYADWAIAGFVNTEK